MKVEKVGENGMKLTAADVDPKTGTGPSLPARSGLSRSLRSCKSGISSALDEFGGLSAAVLAESVAVSAAVFAEFFTQAVDRAFGQCRACAACWSTRSGGSAFSTPVRSLSADAEQPVFRAVGLFLQEVQHGLEDAVERSLVGSPSWRLRVRIMKSCVLKLEARPSVGNARLLQPRPDFLGQCALHRHKIRGARARSASNVVSADTPWRRDRP